jgi:hypothetical protein
MVYGSIAMKTTALTEEEKGTAESQPDNDKREINGFGSGTCHKGLEPRDSRAKTRRSVWRWKSWIEDGQCTHPLSRDYRYPRRHKDRIECLQGDALGGQTMTTTQQ